MTVIGGLFGLLLASLTFVSVTYATPSRSFLASSASREVNESMEEAIDRHSVHFLIQPFSEQGTNVYNSKVESSELNQDVFSQIPEWESFDKLKTLFLTTRDMRLLKDESHAGLRRITWLYPDDGCFARSSLIHSHSKEKKTQKLENVFVFGSLTAKTKNHPSGMVYWWYHVAPAARVGQQVWILDAALEPKGPILFEEWIGKMGLNKSSYFASFCDQNAYNPTSLCNGDKDPTDAARNDDTNLLDSERSRIQELGRNPEAELGDSPPWLQTLLALVTRL
ncbi:MAG: protein-glutamine glutaminase family protein [Pseudobdellovibrionaceae bacterium]